MPIIKSAKKRVRVAKKATIRNRRTKRALRAALKSFNASLSTNKKQVKTALAKSHSAIDKAAKKGVIHKNKAARKKKQLAKAMHASQGSPKPTTKKPTSKKPASTKNATTKKTTQAKASPKPSKSKK